MNRLFWWFLKRRGEITRPDVVKKHKNDLSTLRKRNKNNYEIKFFR